MAKERLCTNCINNNNGWCAVRKTNKGLKDLIICGYRECDGTKDSQKELSMLEKLRLSGMLERKVRHFKNKEYLVLGLVTHTETLELMVHYKALYGKCEEYVRPAKMFLEQVPEGKENPTGQEYRMELIED